MDDSRPDMYKYYDQLMIHLNNNESVFFNNKLVYPRQLEIHLPANHIRSCNLNCPYCAGRYFTKKLGNWELDALELLNNLRGSIPYHIYGGAYTEPLLNPYYLTFLATTKKYGNHFGIHTNGVLLNWLEENQGWLTELNRISTDEVDYLSISIDAGTALDWAYTKGIGDCSLFYHITNGIKKACNIRKKNKKNKKNKNSSHAIRLCYLISPETGNYYNFQSIVNIAKENGVDSLRFSIPFANYNQCFDDVGKYRNNVETPRNIEYAEILKDFLSTSKNEVPYIFYTGPEFTDIDKFNFNKCIYGYYQITLGADGYIYKCSTTATPTAKHCRLGKITSNLDEFNNMIVQNANPNWDCQTMCFDKGLRCNRMGLEINKQYSEINK